MLLKALTRLAASSMLVSAALAGQPAVARAVGAEPAPLPKTEKPPRIDGAVADQAWHRPATFKDFKTLKPSAGREPSERTEVYLTYDRESIYVGLQSFDTEPAKIRSRAKERDNPLSDDWVAFCLDARNDELSALFFMVTPGNVQVDGTLDASGAPNTALDTQWSSATARTPWGWTAEMAIPFKRLPFRWGEQVVMGFKIARFISRKSEEADFPQIAPEGAPHISQFQKIRLSGIERSLVPVDAPLVDIHEIVKRKLRLKTVTDIDTYEGRVREWGDASVVDYMVFPSRDLRPAAKPFHFGRKPKDSNVAQVFEGLEYFPGKKVEDLLIMASGIRYEENEPHFDNRITYLYPDLRGAALNQTVIVEPAGRRWVYNNYHPLLIGMVLERITRKTVAEYLQEKLWTPLGMEYPGSWSINCEKNGLEKMESGINGRSIDFAKLGRLFLNNGRWEGKQIVSESWVEQATQPDQEPSGFYENNPLFYYKYFWWGIKRSGGRSDFFALGNKGQYVYVSPRKSLVIVRNGIDYGLPSRRWVRLFYDFASGL